MSEPTITVDPNQVVFMLGQKEVEIQILRARLIEAEAKIVELTPKTEQANVVPIKEPA